MHFGSRTGANSAIAKGALNYLGVNVGIGMLSLPAVMCYTGWVLGIFFLILSAVLSLYCGIRLCQSCYVDPSDEDYIVYRSQILEKNNLVTGGGELDEVKTSESFLVADKKGLDEIQHNSLNTEDVVIEKEGEDQGIVLTYVETGRRCLGLTGAILTYIGVYGTVIGSACLMIILGAEQFENLFPDSLSVKLWSLIFVATVLPVAFIKKLDHIALVAFWGIFGSIVVVFMVCIYSIINVDNLEEFSPDGVKNDYSTTVWPVGFANVSRAFCTITVSFGGASVFPGIMESLGKHNKKVNWSLAWGTFIALGIFLCMALVNYYVYGQYILGFGSAVDVIPDGWMSKTIGVLLLMHLIPAYIILMNVVFLFFEDLAEKPKDTFWMEWVKRIAIRCLIMSLTCGIAIVVPYFSDVMGLLGATTITLSAYILPLVFYLFLFKINRKSKTARNRSMGTSEGNDIFSGFAYSERRTIPNWEIVLIFAILVLSTCVGAVGVYDGTLALIDAFKNN